MKNSKAISEKQREALVNYLIETMENNSLDWVKTWTTCPPVSATTGKKYRGLNRLQLQYAAICYGFDDPRWAAFGTIKANGWHIPKGCHASCYVEKWAQKTKERKDKDGNIVVDDNGNPIVNTFWYLQNCAAVWNLSQLEGPEPYQASLPQTEGDFSLADSEWLKYLGQMNGGPKLVESAAIVEAGYSPSLDRIQIPSRNLFTSAEAFQSTLAHEMIHSTGHKNRCKRKLYNAFGSEDYAQEELIAELGSIFLMQDYGWSYSPDDSDLENHAAYLQDWLKALAEEDAADWLANTIRYANWATEFIEHKCGMMPWKETEHDCTD